jgi:Predicted metal-binding integral membrane protein (DUF2182)
MRWRRWRASHPEWWALSVSVSAALALVTLVTAGGGDAGDEQMRMSPGVSMPSEAMSSMTGSTMLTSASRMFAMFALMVLVMMVPLSVAAIRITASRSLWRRRQRSVAFYLGGFVLTWAVVGAVLVAILSALAQEHWLEPTPGLAAGAFTIAALWQLTAPKRRALSAHHRTRPLRPDGLGAAYDCVSYGGAGGLQCVLSCGPMMIAMALDMTSLVVIPIVSLVAFAERYSFRPPKRTTAAVLAALAMAVAAS